MAIPNLPVFYDMPYTYKDGALTQEALLYNDQLWQSLNLVVNQFNNGIQLPNFTAAEITTLANDTTVPVGTLWYNTTATALSVKTGAGTYIDIT